MPKQIKTIKGYLAKAMILESTEIESLSGAGKLTEQEVKEVIHLSAVISNALGEMDEILSKFNLREI